MLDTIKLLLRQDRVDAIGIAAVLGAQLFGFPTVRLTEDNDESVGRKRRPIELTLSTDELLHIVPSFSLINRLVVPINLELPPKFDKSRVRISSNRWQGQLRNIFNAFHIQMGPRPIRFVCSLNSTTQ
jgi:hypothetical protein